MLSLSPSILTATVAALLLTSTVSASPVARSDLGERSSSSYWLANIARNGSPPFGTAGYTIYRDVTKYGADASGQTDSTAAINKAISDGGRCGKGCDSSTTSPAIVYFPPGTYLVSKPIVQYYYTQLIGDAINPPTLKASSGFVGMAVIDSDPYEADGSNWFTNQNLSLIHI